MPPKIDTPPAISERNQSIYERRQQGETIAAIARDLGISTSRVGQIVKNVQREINIQRKYPILTGDEITLQASVLSVLEKRVGRTLYRAGIGILQDIVDLIIAKGWCVKREPGNPYCLYLGDRRMRNAGRVAWGHITSALDSVGFDWRQHAT